MEKITSINIGLIMYPNVQQSIISSLIDFFFVANKVAKKKLDQREYLPQINLVKIDNPVFYAELPSFIVDHSKKELSALVIPPCLNHPPLIEQCKDFIDFIKTYHQQNIILASIDNGTFLLAETGLLDMLTVAIHWQYEFEFKRRYPDIHMDMDKLLCFNNNIITTAGMLSWSDLGLQLVKHFFGKVVMAEVANIFLLQPAGRAQNHFNVFEPCLTHGDSAILKSQEWIVTQKKLNITLEELAQATHLEIRTLQRRFLKATGMTITEYLQRYRMHRAQTLLQNTKESIDAISVQCGYKDLNAFRKIFIKVVGLSPNLYRKNFMLQ